MASSLHLGLPTRVGGLIPHGDETSTSDKHIVKTEVYHPNQTIEDDITKACLNPVAPPMPKSPPPFFENVTVMERVLTKSDSDSGGSETISEPPVAFDIVVENVIEVDKMIQPKTAEHE